MKRLQINGERFGSLIVLRSACSRDGRWFSVCKCDCGNETVVANRTLVAKHTKSCGCLLFKGHPTHGATCGVTHGGIVSPTYAAWKNLKQRCSNQDHPGFKNYGGRGITVCSRWLESFEAFLKDMGERPYGMSIDRINNSLGYGPDNCRWASRKTQARNTRSNRLITFNGITATLIEMAEAYDLPYETVRARLKLGWDINKVLTHPLHRR